NGLKEVSISLESVQKNQNKLGYLVIILSGLAAILLLGQEFRRFLGSKDYISDLLLRFRVQRESLGPSIILLNIVFGALSLFMIMGAYYLNRLYVTGNLASELGNVYLQLNYFLSNYDLAGIFDLVLLVISVFLLIDIILLCWFKLDAISRAKDRLVNTIRNWCSPRARDLISSVLLILAGLLTSGLVIGEFYPILELDKGLSVLGILIMFSTALIFNGKVAGKDKATRRLFGGLFLLLPSGFLLIVLYSHLLPFGMEKTYQWRFGEEAGSEMKITEVTALSNVFELVPRFNQKRVGETLSQKLHSKDSVYVEITSERRGAETYLFFDKALAHFPYKTELVSNYVYSKGKFDSGENGEQALDELLPDQGNIGLDLEVLSDSSMDFKGDKFNLYDYFDDIYSKSGRLDLELGISGNQVYYTVLNGSLDLNLTYEDANSYWGRDAMIIRVSDKNGDVVVSEFMDDDNGVFGEGPVTRNVQIVKDNIENGVYRIEVAADSLVDVKSTLSSDITVKRIQINSDKLVYSGLESDTLEIEGAHELYFLPLEKSLTVSGNNQPESFGLITENNFDAGGLRYWERYFDYEISNAVLSRLEISESETIIGTKFNLYSFSKDSYFYPFKYYFTQIDRIDDVIITKSNLQVNEEGGNWYNATLDLGERDFVFGIPVYYKFYLAQSALDTYTDYEINNFYLKLKK
ncbi:MAG: hypothetical protein PHS44_07715, partial [Candidatus Dojkabacteria bacterium]|nr:hypothetical protein [Candidatus Dojkabacteria bacterium]